MKDKARETITNAWNGYRRTIRANWYDRITPFLGRTLAVLIVSATIICTMAVLLWVFSHPVSFFVVAATPFALYKLTQFIAGKDDSSGH